ncbi:MAG: GNAT family N-acetyltransferase [Planctomycetales bacterium]|nr:GNAT family N-acetyltransferase [Planctomycetales bacterium]
MTPEEAGRALLVSEDLFVRLGTRSDSREDHVRVSCPEARAVHTANHFREIVLPPATDPDQFVLDRIGEAMDLDWPITRIEVDDRTFPANIGHSLGQAEFLPEVYIGMAAAAGDLRKADPPFPVREAATEDLRHLEGLLASEQLEDGAGVDAAAGALHILRARLETRRWRVLLAMDGERPAGQVALVESGPFLRLKDVYVSSAHRGQGVGKSLLSAAAERARAGGRDLLGLFTAANSDLLAFYGGAGFRAVTRRETWLRSRPTDEM